ncbi:hypothetical protein DSECCO2_480780 [anaerobic digester metagenome]
MLFFGLPRRNAKSFYGVVIHHPEFRADYIIVIFIIINGTCSQVGMNQIDHQVGTVRFGETILMKTTTFGRREVHLDLVIQKYRVTAGNYILIFVTKHGFISFCLKWLRILIKLHASHGRHEKKIQHVTTAGTAFVDVTEPDDDVFLIMITVKRLPGIRTQLDHAKRDYCHRAYPTITSCANHGIDKMNSRISV